MTMFMPIRLRILDSDIGDKGHGQDGDAARRKNPPNFTDRSQIVFDVLEHVRTIHKIKRPVGKG
jgi:hypothetical protein